MRRAMLAVGLVALAGPCHAAAAVHAAEPPAKPAIRGIVAMGAYPFVGRGGDPDIALAPLNELGQDCNVLPLVPEAKLRQSSALVEANRTR